MVTGDPVDVNLTTSPSSRKIPALLTKNSAQPCQIENCGGIMWIRVHPIDDDDDDGIQKLPNDPKLSQIRSCSSGLIGALLSTFTQIL